ncbi:MAG: hypothetical protein WC725_05120 [Patescibacteria group bacterium]|jgi:hypothetical protein
MFTIKIKETIGENCITRVQGGKIFKLLTSPSRFPYKTTLDFAGVKIISAPFINAAIGRLFEVNGNTEPHKVPSFVNLSHQDETMIKHVIDGAKDYYTKSLYERTQHDNIVANAIRHANECSTEPNTSNDFCDKLKWLTNNLNTLSYDQLSKISKLSKLTNMEIHKRFPPKPQ